MNPFKAKDGEINYLVNHLKINKEDILYYQFRPQTFLPACYLAVDKLMKSIVLGVRGSLGITLLKIKIYYIYYEDY